MKAIVVGRHNPNFGDLNIEIIETRNVVFPVSARECVPILLELEEEARAKKARVILQNTPSQVAAAFAWIAATRGTEAGLWGGIYYGGAYSSEYDPPIFGVVVTVPGPRPGTVREVFTLRGDVTETIAAIKFANPRAKVELAGYDEPDRHGNVGYEPGICPIAVEVDGPPSPFVFSHIEWIL